MRNLIKINWKQSMKYHEITNIFILITNQSVNNKIERVHFEGFCFFIGKF